MHDYSYYLQTVGEIGEVTRVKHPLVTVEGLPHARLQEVVMFENGQVGQVFTINQDTTDIILFSHDHIKVGDQLSRTNTFPTIPVGTELLGTIIDPLGNNLLTDELLQAHEHRSLEVPPLGIGKRALVQRFLTTGVSLVDMMIPLGKGQKELIIGDRKTGKSSFVLTAMQQQAAEGAVIIYAAIGKKNSEIKSLVEKINQNVAQKQIIVVATASSDSPGLIFLTPFAAVTIAEYFRDQGIDTLVVLDDLSTHAKYYREIALVAKNFPGRDSYPGDIFYTHARLLERAGNFLHAEKGEVAITCFPLTETVEGDMASFIATNLMGITDGHILFDSDLFYKGRRPGINTTISVSRVGRQTQGMLAQEITRELTAFLADYETVQNLAHFGSELNEQVKETLAKGERLTMFFDQEEDILIPQAVQIVLFALVWLNDDQVQHDGIDTVRERLTRAYQEKTTNAFFATLLQETTLAGLLKKVQENTERIYHLWQQTKK